jgi:hypothetical protein
MTLGEIVELIFGFALLAFMLFFIIVVPIGLINDANKPRPRKRSRSTYKKYKINWAELRDFEYTGQHNSSEFLVYFIENENLNALKVGVGTGGRLLQLLESYTSKSIESTNVGWKILKVAKFTDSNSDYILDKIYGEQAEKKAHYYWRYVLNLPIYLNQNQLGYSQVKEYGNIRWVLTKGYTETAELNKVCEVSTWNFIKASPGFIEEVTNFMGNASRELKLLHSDHSLLNEPPGYADFKLQRVRHSKNALLNSPAEKTLEEKFWEKVDRDSGNCWLWTGAVTKKGQKNSYAIFSHEGRNQLAQRVAWAIDGLETISNSTLENTCGTKTCVKPEHWTKTLRRLNSLGEKLVSAHLCTNEGCDRPSMTITKPSLCEPCKQSVKRKRRRGNKKISTYQCTNDGCSNPSVTTTKSSLCEKCRQTIYRDKRKGRL